MFREIFLSQLPEEMRGNFKQYAGLYDSMLSAIKQVDETLTNLNSKLKRGFLVEGFKLEFVTNCRVLAEEFPEIGGFDSLFFGIIMDEMISSDSFKNNFQPLTDFFDDPVTLKSLILFDNISLQAPTQIPSVTIPFLESMQTFYQMYILFKETFNNKTENPKARALYNKLMRTYEETANSDNKAIKAPFTAKMLDCPEDPHFPSGTTKGSSQIDKTIISSIHEDATNAPPEGSTVSTSASEQTFDELIEELNSLIGLQSIKNDVFYQINMVRAQRIRAERGLKTVPISLHLVFTGNPGTGKTTVARLIAKLYKEIGVLKTGQLVECDRAGLVAGYVGQTAIKTQEKIDEALGGVLFIDEAYSLVKGGNDFGMEAIETLLKAMEDHRDELVVIVAGYPDLMETFINSNPGLRSRFSRFIYFPDYNEQELFQIFEMMCTKYDYRMTPGAAEKVKERIHQEKVSQKRNFANARTVRNIFEAAVTRQSVRTTNISSHDELTLLTETDIV